MHRSPPSVDREVPQAVPTAWGIGLQIACTHVLQLSSAADVFLWNSNLTMSCPGS